ncbi:riboflavin synthase subunit alpha [Arsenophonus symbiont of Ornithomya chloropus]|uniref:riboflavin synthase subunit alpha n=1 Tax=Arsenophonus symbiont of Ornithomya chloropus TaxID=634121 RepID=UPI0032B28917
MFTGIVQGKGTLFSIKKKVNFRTYTVKFPQELLNGLEIGASVSNNGCCLSVTRIFEDKVTFDLMQETLHVTNLGNLKIGDKINLERSAKHGDEIGGHIMSGHIICTVDINEILKAENNITMWFHVQHPFLMKYILYKGFIGIDGISLTIGDIVNHHFCVHLIPETIARTNIADKNLGDTVNIEIDTNIQGIVDTVERMMLQIYSKK